MITIHNLTHYPERHLSLKDVLEDKELQNYQGDLFLDVDSLAEAFGKTNQKGSNFLLNYMKQNQFINKVKLELEETLKYARFEGQKEQTFHLRFFFKEEEPDQYIKISILPIEELHNVKVIL